MVLQTPRLALRRLTEEDWPHLAEILQNPQVMVAYEGPFTDEEVSAWLANQLRRYREDGIGLWAVLRRENGAFLGQCGLTRQNVEGETLCEVGYLFKARHWHRGYATEAAAGCMRYAFETLGERQVCSIIREGNTASENVALRNGMAPVKRFVKHYKGVDMPHTVYMAQPPPPGRRPDKAKTKQ